jgi:hypothetical protein
MQHCSTQIFLFGWLQNSQEGDRRSITDESVSKSIPQMNMNEYDCFIFKCLDVISETIFKFRLYSYFSSHI